MKKICFTVLPFAAIQNDEGKVEFPNTVGFQLKALLISYGIKHLKFLSWVD